ncbi:hypothetical protein S7711_01647 [Stachybotrys chartarum IBT 7711]|uniref:Proline dehydrogenase n=1 Tax=Stachybotrys chartarum (strain CBS 109288 / IBT 7711) TaxID=1280523 RepID=A0A084AV59_STACB|nr:hypothetical protein S7711_01647 [Stachybotrys chartarum IBT 7711]KFA53743.1 hypothetical protein S40293_01675 [Stachybotrys chartarum IBT 40293]
MTAGNSPVPEAHSGLAPRRSVPGYPLSVMPTTMLLRSMLVSTISANRFLLLPALSFLSFLSKPERGLLLNVDRNPALHWILRKTFYDQFCAGETKHETKACVRRLRDLGFRGVILTYAKEITMDHYVKALKAGVPVAASEAGEVGIDADIESWRDGVMTTVDMIGDGDYLALKLTGAGLTVTKALAGNELPPQQMMDALTSICEACKRQGIKVIVDAESQDFQKAIDRVTLELMRKFNRHGHAAVFNTYQVYLKSTPANILQHLTQAADHDFTLGLKIVRGAYILSETRGLIHDTKQETDDAYNMVAQGALKRQLGQFGGDGPSSRSFPSVDLLVATHNRKSALDAQRLHRQRTAAGLPTVPVVFGQLHGMSDEVSFSLLQEGEGAQEPPEVVKCSTWGSMGQCLAYLLRRAVENRDAVLRTTDERAALKAECWRRFKGVFSLG